MSVVFFTDRDLGLQFPAILKSGGLSVERHADHFAHDTPDVQWLKTVADNGWVAVTHDKRIRYKPNELAAVMDNHLALIVVVGDAPFADLATAFVASSAKVIAFLESRTPPFIAKVYRPTPSELARNANATGRIEMWHS